MPAANYHRYLTHSAATWYAFGAALLVCLLLVGQFALQDQRVQRAAELTSELGRARDDFRLGFMHLALDTGPKTPWERERGLALLQQALASYDETLETLMTIDKNAAQVSERFTALREQVLTYSQTSSGEAASEKAGHDLRVLMFDLIEGAAGLDAQIRFELNTLVDESRTVFLWSSIVATALLASLAFVVLRVQAAAIDSAKRLAQSEERWRFAIEGAGDGVWDWDVPSKRVLYSRRWKEILGFGDHEIGEDEHEWSSRVHPEDLKAVVDALGMAMKGEAASFAHEHRMRKKDGGWAWILSRGKVVARTLDGAPSRVIGTHTDISENKANQDLIWKQANFDALTGLPNRRMLLERLKLEVQRTVVRHERLAVMFVDIDRFKEVNETLGHAAGDTLLVEIGRRIQRCVSGGDIVSRTGGDEFAIVVPWLGSEEHAQNLAERVLREISKPIPLDGRVVHTSASIGITVCPGDAQDEGSLLKNADQALSAAKEAGRNRVEFYTAELQRHALLRALVTSELRAAVEARQFSLVYQPIVHLPSREIHKAEALVRWNHPTKGTINPAVFIPIAESTGLIEPLGDWIFKEAADTVSKWRTRFDPSFQLSVNKSPLQFKETELGDTPLVRLLHTLGLPGQAMVVEITEGLLLDPKPGVQEALANYRDSGVRVALDDFGTGFSSLSYLQKYDIDFIKIDRSFVSDLALGNKNHALCKAIITMAHELGMQVIAEGIETDLQMQLLHEAGCDFGQGYLWGKPMSLLDFEIMAFSQKTVVSQ